MSLNSSLLCSSLGMPQSTHTSSYGALPPTHPAAFNDDPKFMGPIASDHPAVQNHALHTRLYEVLPEVKTQPLLCSKRGTKCIISSILDSFVHRRTPIDMKEVLESTEFYLRTRKRILPADTVYDLACGHGLVGIILSACNPDVDVICVDIRRPVSFEKILDAVAAVKPHVIDRVKFIEAPLSDLQAPISPSNISVVATHACGSLTDTVLDFARVCATRVAVMPCCYTGTASNVPNGVRRMLGVGVSADIDRCYRLEREGWQTDMTNVPKLVTPMNRIIVAQKK